jgi:hypothetical protein
MLSRPCSSAYALRIPALLLALTAGVVPARAQRVPVALGLPAEPGYVSLSGALTFGFTQHRITAAFYESATVPMKSSAPMFASPAATCSRSTCRFLNRRTCM